MKPRVLLVHNVTDELASVGGHLPDSRFSVTRAHGCDEALHEITSASTPFDLALLDGAQPVSLIDQPERREWLPDRRADRTLDILGAIRSRSPETDVLLLMPRRDNGQAVVHGAAVSTAGGFAAAELAEIVKEWARRISRRRTADVGLDRVLKLAADVRSSLDLDDVFRRTCRTGRSLLRLSHCAIVLFSSDLTNATLVAEYPAGASTHEPVSLLDVPAARHVIETGQVHEICSPSMQEQLGAVWPAASTDSVATMLLAPIAVRDSVLGCILASSVRRTGFSAAEKRSLERLAALVALAVQNARLHRESRVAADRLDTIRRTLRLDVPAERQGLLRRVIGDAVNVVNARGGGIYRHDAQAGTLTVVADFLRPENEGRTIRVGEGLAGRLVQRAQERVANSERPGLSHATVCDYSEYEGRAGDVYSPNSFGSVLELLLEWHGDIVGVLYVDDVPGRVFSEDDVRALRTNAAQGSVALADITPPGQDWIEPFTALKDILDVGISGLDHRLTWIAAQAARIVHAESAGVFLVREPGWLSLEASYGHPDGGFEKGKRLPIRPMEGLTGHIAFHQKVFRAHGEALTGHPAVRSVRPRHLRFGRCCSLVALPLSTHRGGERSLKALLRLENKLGPDGKPSPAVGFSSADERTLQIFGEMVVIALTNADLVSELRDNERLSERRRELLTRLPDAVLRLQTESDAQALRRAVVKEAVDVIGGAAGCLYLNQHKMRQLEAVATQNLPKAHGWVEPYSASSFATRALSGRTAKISTGGDQPGELGGGQFHTLIGVPFSRTPGQVEGVLVVAGNSAHHPFVELEGQVLEQLAGHVAVLFQLSELGSWPRRTEEQLYAHLQFKQYLQRANSEEKALAAFLTAVTAGYGLGFNRAAVYLLDDDRGAFEGRAAIGDVDENLARQEWHRNELPTVDEYLDALERDGVTRTRLDELTCGVRWDAGLVTESRPLRRAASQGSALLDTAEEFDQLPREIRQALDSQGDRRPRPLAVVPLQSAGALLGVLVADNLFSQETVTRENLQRLLELAEVAAAVLTKLRPSRGALMREAPEPLPRDHSWWTPRRLPPRGLGAGAHGSIVARACQLLRSTSAVLWCRDRSGDWKLEDWSGVGSQHWDAFQQHPAQPGYTTDKVVTERWLCVPDVADVARTPFITAETRDLLRRTGAKSFQAAAILYRSEVLGVLYWNYDTERSFDDVDRERAIEVASHAALVLNAARTWDNSNRLFGQLEAGLDVAAVGVLLSLQEHRMRDRAAKLEILLGELHDALAASGEGGIPQEIMNLVSAMREPPVFDGLFQTAEADVADVLVELRSEEAPRWTSAGFEFTVRLPGYRLPVRANRLLLKEAFRHIANNARSALESRREPARRARLEVTAVRAGDYAAVEFADTGDGMPADVRDDVFVRPIDTLRARGSGLGLMAARTTLVAYGGEASVASTSEAGTTISAWLPLSVDRPS